MKHDNVSFQPHLFTELLQADLKPALGVTEPAAIALACATARALSEEPVLRVQVSVNSGIYKNAFTCGIPNTEETGNDFAAAIGCFAGNAKQGLYVLDGIAAQDVEKTRCFLKEGRVAVTISAISPELFICAVVETEHDRCEARICHNHTNVCYLAKNGAVILDKIKEQSQSEEKAQNVETKKLSSHTLQEMVEYATTVPVGEFGFIVEAHAMNQALAEVGFASERCIVTQSMLRAGGGKRVANQRERDVLLLTTAAIEARVLGLNAPAMSITGSGNHGIICTLPLAAICHQSGAGEESLLRATALCHLVTMYIKEYSGKLSAFCGCAIAGGTGMACGAALLLGGALPQVQATLYNMANSIVGMICQGGNHGCVMKVAAAVKTAFCAVELGLDDVSIPARHGIGGATPEETMRNIGYIAVPGMLQTEQAIIDIFEQKKASHFLG